jgi:hypothetical protein
MMNEFQLPDEFEELEQLLTNSPRPQPSAALRGRVLRRMRCELHQEQILPTWRAAAAFAATVLVALSLWLGVLQASTAAMQQVQNSPSIDEIAWQLRQISPTLSQTESLRQAWLRQAGAEANGGTPLGDLLFLTSENEFHHP